MTGYATEFFTMMFQKLYLLFNSVVFPGTSFTVFGVIVVIGFLRLVIGIIRMVFGFEFSVIRADAMSMRLNEYNGGNNRNIKISDERRNDAF